MVGIGRHTLIQKQILFIFLAIAMFPLIWWRNKGVTVTRSEILAAYKDLLRYYQEAPETENTTIIKNILLEVLNHEKHN